MDSCLRRNDGWESWSWLGIGDNALALACVTGTPTDPRPLLLVATTALAQSPPTFTGLRTTLYVVDDVDRAGQWYTQALRAQPHTSSGSYVGFTVGGFELGLIPANGETRAGAGGTLTYWGVSNAEAAVDRLLGMGATPFHPIDDVGGGVRMGVVRDPFGNLFGVIELPGDA